MRLAKHSPNRDADGLYRLELKNPDAIGQRLIAANGFFWFREIAALLIDGYPDGRTAYGQMPNWLSRLASLFVHDTRPILNDLEVIKELDNSTAINLGWGPSAQQQDILSGAKSLIDLGVV